MEHMQKLEAPEEIDGLGEIQGATTLNASLLRLQCPDETWYLRSADGGPLKARCSLWWREAPQGVPGQRVGVIGHYGAADGDSGLRLLAHAAQQLAEQGCTMAVGPMDGNTWRRYRLMTDCGDDAHEPPFFMEPVNPMEWPNHFVECGFKPLAQYYSAMNENLNAENPKAEHAMERFSAEGITIRPIETQHFTEELSRIHQVSLESFHKNFLYTPIGLDEFVAQYQAVREMIVPELALIAECAGEPVGFLFALPDLLQKQRGQKVDTVIAKTVAVLPGHRQSGLGSVLLAQVHGAARRLGFRRAIHALIHENNVSLKLSAHTARIFRRYTLFAKELSR